MGLRRDASRAVQRGEVPRPTGRLHAGCRERRAQAPASSQARGGPAESRCEGAVFQRSSLPRLVARPNDFLARRRVRAPRTGWLGKGCRPHGGQGRPKERWQRHVVLALGAIIGGESSGARADPDLVATQQIRSHKSHPTRRTPRLVGTERRLQRRRRKGRAPRLAFSPPRGRCQSLACGCGRAGARGGDAGEAPVVALRRGAALPPAGHCARLQAGRVHTAPGADQARRS